MLQGVDPVKAAQSLAPSALRDTNLRSAEVANAASKVAAIPEVRTALVAFQKSFAVEGMNAGLPVIYGDVSGLREIVTPQAGLAVDPKDDQAIETALSRLLHEPDLRQSMGRVAYERAQAYGTEKKNAGYFALWQEQAT